MKVLLIGEHGNVYWTLAQTLREMGHTTDVLSNSDLWLNSSGPLFTSRSVARWGVLKKTFNLLKMGPRLKGYDVVQLSGPTFLDLNPELLRFLFQYLKKHNRKVFLGAYGYDFYWIYLCLNNHTLDYSDFYANGSYRDTIDNHRHIVRWMHGARGKLNRFMAAQCNGIVASRYEAYMAYQLHFPEKTRYIPFPIEPLPHPQHPSPHLEKVKFYISLKHHSEEWKGKDKLYSALYLLQYKYPDACEIKQNVFMPYDNHESSMDGCDVLLDQLYSYSPGLNALYAMSKGIVTVGGAEEAHYRLLGEEQLRPIVNVRPDRNNLYDQLEELVVNKEVLCRRSAQGIAYLQRHHCPTQVAHAYLSFWEEK